MTMGDIDTSTADQSFVSDGAGETGAAPGQIVTLPLQTFLCPVDWEKAACGGRGWELGGAFFRSGRDGAEEP